MTGIAQDMENGAWFGSPITWEVCLHYGLLPDAQYGAPQDGRGGHSSSTRRGGSRSGASRRGSRTGGSAKGSRKGDGARSGGARSVASWGNATRVTSVAGSRRGGSYGKDPMDEIAEEMEGMSLRGSHRHAHRYGGGGRGRRGYWE